ncbi:HAMP domain-containing sensor histidine kinase [Marinobacteraceae bacterium S3BR75-40.1]
MSVSVSRRIYRLFFILSLVNSFILLLAVEFADENLEDTMINVDMVDQKSFFKSQLDGSGVQTWQTANLQVTFIPAGHSHTLSPLFQDLQPPYTGELERNGETHLINVETLESPPGTLYIAKNITQYEKREDLLLIALAFVAAGMVSLSFVVAQLSARKLVRPLRRLTHEIRATLPGKQLPHIFSDYDDTELREIATTFNRFLDELSAYVAREQSLLALASHELRTPLAAISGALDVLEQRQQPDPKNQRTLNRIRQATREMQEDVRVLLKLSRGSGEPAPAYPMMIAEVLADVLREFQAANPEQSQRIQLQSAASETALQADPALVRILLRNLIQNALTHTRGAIRISLHERGLQVADEGAGLPETVIPRIQPVPATQMTLPEGSGLGLFIVRLVCERLDWHLNVEQSSASGTIIAVAWG